MQKFKYRTPRYQVDLPVRFTVDNQTITGRCREISKEGMRLEVFQPLPPDFCGTVTVTYQDLTIELRACVAHAGARHEGLKFVFDSDHERDAVARLVAYLADPPAHPRPVLIR